MSTRSTRLNPIPTVNRKDEGPGSSSDEGSDAKDAPLRTSTTEQDHPDDSASADPTNRDGETQGNDEQDRSTSETDSFASGGMTELENDKEEPQGNLAPSLGAGAQAPDLQTMLAILMQQTAALQASQLKTQRIQRKKKLNGPTSSMERMLRPGGVPSPL